MGIYASGHSKSQLADLSEEGAAFGRQISPESRLRIAHFVGAGQRVGVAVGEFENEVAFLIQIEHTTENLALRSFGSDLAAEEPASWAHFGDGRAEIISDALELSMK